MSVPLEPTEILRDACCADRWRQGGGTFATAVTIDLDKIEREVARVAGNCDARGRPVPRPATAAYRWESLYAHSHNTQVWINGVRLDSVKLTMKDVIIEGVC